MEVSLNTSWKMAEWRRGTSGFAAEVDWWMCSGPPAEMGDAPSSLTFQSGSFLGLRYHGFP